MSHSRGLVLVDASLNRELVVSREKRILNRPFDQGQFFALS
jgi:hypothetical protein